MANISDAFGTIKVKNVGKQFIEFINKAQDGAYYLLADPCNINDSEIQEDNSVVIEFNAGGRWNYFRNIEGYLKGEWFKEKLVDGNVIADDEGSNNYKKFIQSFIENNGEIEICYSDSDTGLEWLGNGSFLMEVIDGELSFIESFEQEYYNISNFAKLNGESELWAMEYMYDEDVSEKYTAYVESWKKTHEYIPGVSEPAGPSEWYDNEYQEE